MLGDAPDIHALPVGNAGNITAYWRGYKEYRHDRISSKLPQMWGFQAAGAAPLVKGKPVLKPETIATAIRIGKPASWYQAIDARDSSGGVIDSVTDKEILAAYALVAGKEGVFVEPSSAAGIAGLIKYKKAGKLPKDKRIVITVTGHGLKDISWALETFTKPKVVKVNAAAAAKALGLKN
jgi:threonine synthase